MRIAWHDVGLAGLHVTGVPVGTGVGRLRVREESQAPMGGRSCGVVANSRG
jgi:hypothetical protein